MIREPIIFNEIEVSREQIVRAARTYMMVDYNRKRNYISYTTDGGADLLRSSLNCLGFLFVVAREVGLLDWSFDLNRARWDRNQTLDGTVREILETNFERIKKNRARNGDLLLMWYRDVNKEVTGPHHVAIKASALPNENQYRGTMIHAVELSESGKGRVIEQAIDKTEWARVHSVWRLKNLDEFADPFAVYGV